MAGLELDLSVVIVNYNGERLLRPCLDSMLAAASGLALEVFVVDNGSGDGSVALVRDGYPDVTVIANADNLGFARANNQALAVSRGRNSRCITCDSR